MPETFEAAVYTNCALGKGLEGVAGMQWQSRTPRADWELLAFLKQHLLYEPPEQFVQAGRPAAEFPPSMAHVFEDPILATSSGRYQGREMDGPRQGNHLTHAISTEQRTSYGSIRPAQLAHASFWLTSTPPGTDLSGPPADWEPGPIDAAVAARHVRARRGGDRMLAALVSTLADRDLLGRRRVALITRDAEDALRWLVAATLLLPQDRALEIGFKVFSMAPARSKLQVVAVHPEWSDFPASIDQDNGYAVFDLETRRHSPVPVSPEAANWARLFCTEDPVAVAEAVDLAAGSGLGGTEAQALAIAATLGRSPGPALAPTVLRWLRGGPPVVREAYGALLIEAVVEDADLPVLRELESLSRRTEYAHARPDVLLRATRAEFAAVEADPDAAVRHPPRWSVTPDFLPEASDITIQSLRTMRPPAFAAALTVAASLGVTVRLDDVGEAADRFFAGWAENSQAPYDLSRWNTEPRAIERLTRELRRRPTTRSHAVVLARNWFPRIQPRGYPAGLKTPFDQALLSTAMTHDLPRRERLVAENLPKAAADGPDRFRDLVEVLWAGTEPTAEELGRICDHRPDGVELPPRLFASLRTRVHQPFAQAADLNLWLRLSECGLLTDKSFESTHAHVNQLKNGDARLQEALSRKFDATHPPREWLFQLPPELLKAQAVALANQIFEMDDLPSAGHLVERLPDEIAERLASRLAKISEIDWPPGRAALAFYLLFRPKSSPAAQNGLTAPVGDWIKSHPAKDLKEAGERLGRVHPEWANRWRERAGLKRLPEAPVTREADPQESEPAETLLAAFKRLWSSLMRKEER
ncbi:GTPase-associated protein 1-related protein [Actinoplanes sp. HUAS TT8]|uniref:GTPase-associated protein 1-related protein n=1 Tax=Actinoplanes sp. HUAS TT8 TaxID=3447453 RepID=UPI003F51F964